MPESQKLRILVTGPTQQAAMARPVKWTIEAGYDVWVVGRCRPQNIPKGSYRYLPSPAAGMNRVLQPILPRKLCHMVFALVGAVEYRIVAWILRPDAVHVHFMHKEAAACALARLHPLIVSVWGGLSSEKKYPKRRLNRFRLVPMVLRHASALIVEHSLLQEQIHKLCITDTRIETFTLGINTSVFKPGLDDERKRWRRQLQIADEDVVCLSSRGMADYYRQEEILEAFARAVPRFDRPAKLVFVKLTRSLSRRNIKYDKQLEHRIRELGLEEAVRWVPQQAYCEMPGVYALADCMLNYPKSDIFPSTLLEAAACERLIISTELPAYENTYLESCAVLTARDDMTALTEALIDFVNGDPARYEDRLRRGREIVCELYEEEQERQKMLGLIEEVARRPGVRNADVALKPTASSNRD